MTSTTTLPGRHLASRPPALLAFAWTAVFVLWHGYWALGGDFGFGDRQAAFPDTTSSLAGWIFTVAVAGMFAAGLAVPLAVVRGRGRRRPLAWLLWAGSAVLAARGLSGLLDDVLRFGGLSERGLSGLTNAEVLGSAHPSAYTIWSTIGLDSFFALGGALFGRAALRSSARPGRRTWPAPRRLLAGRSLAWAAYAASAWAAAYAIFVRGYQGLGGTVGLAGTFEDPAGMRRASLAAGAFILLVAVGELGLVREWGRRLPRPLVIAPALAGSVFAAAHALTAYITKPLDALGLIHLQFRGWAHVDTGALMRWDLLFYEPWFLGLAVLTVLGTLHHHRRTGGSPEAARRLILATAVGTLALTAYATALVAT